MDSKIILTKDGSHTLYVPKLNEYYHSTFGAVQESMHIYINNGLNYYLENFKNLTKDLSILEIGFGTGLNTLLSYINSKKLSENINYHTIDLYPVNKNIIGKLNYSKVIENSENHMFNYIHDSEWNKEIIISKNFRLFKILDDFTKYKFKKKYDVIFFDAFAPDIQPEMWTIEQFEKIYKAMNKNGVLTTYSAKGEVKRNLKKNGFKLALIPGPPGKREFIRATK